MLAQANASMLYSKTFDMNKINIYILICILCSGLPPVIANGQQPTESNYRPFVSSEYKPNEFKVAKKEFLNGNALIRITQAKKISNFKNPPHVCRAWLEVANLQQTTFKKYFDDIEAVGFSFGLFIPEVQPPSPFFAVVKNGDYDGRLFLIRTDGNVFDIPGGFYFITKDKSYLFSVYASDASGIVVFDLKEGRYVLSSDKLPYIHQWYAKNGTYFFTESEWLPANTGMPSEKKGVAYFYDFKFHKIVKKSVSITEVASAKKVAYDFDPREYEDCTISLKKNIKK